MTEEPKGSPSGRVSEDQLNDWGTDRYRKFSPQGPITRIPTPNYFAQERRAQELHFLSHQQLIADGWEWDGMDGYTAPEVKK